MTRAGDEILSILGLFSNLGPGPWWKEISRGKLPAWFKVGSEICDLSLREETFLFPLCDALAADDAEDSLLLLDTCRSRAVAAAAVFAEIKDSDSFLMRPKSFPNSFGVVADLNASGMRGKGGKGGGDGSDGTCWKRSSLCLSPRFFLDSLPFVLTGCFRAATMAAGMSSPLSSSLSKLY